SELETAARAGINTITVVNNNGALSQTERGWQTNYAESQREHARNMWMFRNVDFVAVAESMGCLGIRVEKPADVAGALERALSAKRPVLIDAITDIAAKPIGPWD
ncbi:MAG: thiamine pyrophosphate-dependent enzyme, partial [Chloroflexota bacterium]